MQSSEYLRNSSKTKAMHYMRNVQAGFSFLSKPSRFLAFFITDLIFLFASLPFLLSASPQSLLDAIPTSSGTMFLPFGAGVLSALFLLWILVNIFISLGLTAASVRGTLSQGFSAAKSCFIYGLCAMALLQLVYFFFQSAPNPAGILLGLLFSLFTTFVLQAVVLDNKGPISAIEHSISIVRKNFIHTIVFFILVLIFSIIILGMFAFPFLFLLSLIVFQAPPTSALGFGQFYSALSSNFNALLVTFIILLLGRAIVSAFSIKAITSFYVQLAQKRK